MWVVGCCKPNAIQTDRVCESDSERDWTGSPTGERDRERATAPGWSWRDFICVVTNGETIITELSVELMDKML